MFDRIKKSFTTKKISIGKGSDNNVAIQDSKIDNLVLCNGIPDLIRGLGNLEQYEAVQDVFKQCIIATRQIHPLQPYYTVQYNNHLNRLVSTPETEDALKKYPRKIISTILLDYAKYPFMDKSETPWAYAYRTQTKVELQTTAYKEYLGDTEDPFPTIKYSDGLVTVIVPPEFPEPVEASIISGDISIPIRLRRKACMEYGVVVLGTVSDDAGFDIQITAYDDARKTNFKFTTIPGCDLPIQLQREKLIANIKNTHDICIMVGKSVLLKSSIDERELVGDIFTNAPILAEYFENLQTIEKITGCKFDLSLRDVNISDRRTARILASSLKDEWCTIKTNYDNEIRFDYNNIPDDIANDANSLSDKIVEGRVLKIFLQGQSFYADRYTIVYRNARINNIKSIEKNRKKRKKDILFTFRPLEGYDYFYKCIKLENAKKSDD